MPGPVTSSRMSDATQSVLTTSPQAVKAVLEARLIALLDNGLSRFSTSAGTLDLKLPEPLPLGAHVRIAPQADGRVNVTLIGARPDEAGTTHMASANGAQGAAAPVSTPARAFPPQQGMVVPGGSDLAAGTSINARLVATAADGVARFALPGGAEIALRLPNPAAIPPGSTVRLVPERAGRVLVQPPPAAEGEALAAMQASALLRREALRTGAVRQSGLAPVMADAEALAKAPETPPDVAAAARRLLDGRLDGETLSGDSLAKAAGRSGLFLEAVLAGGKAPPADDLKALLGVLKQALGSWLGPQAGTTEPDLAHRILPPPPPASDSGPAAEPVRLAPANGDAVETLGRRLLGETDGALARIQLHQLASTPDPTVARDANAAAQRWSFDIPIALAGHTAVAGFVVEREGQRSAPKPGRPEDQGWRLRAALDTPVTGPVQADVRLHALRTTVLLVAERTDIAAALEENLPALREALVEGGLEPDALVVRTGSPAPPPAHPGRFLDRRG